MASAAEQLASNLSLASFSKATELKKRLWFTLGALVLFRLLSFVPIPGIDPRALANLFQTQQGGVLDFFNTFSGGSIEVLEKKDPAALAAAKKGKVREVRLADKAAKTAAKKA